MISWIVNADDFGLNADVNDAILMCFEKEIITTTTLMVNMPAAQDAVIAAEERGFLSQVGLHLNLTQGTPLTAPIRSFPNFCDRSGRFNAQFHKSTKTRLMLSKAELAAVREEARAQMERYLALGLTLMHLDSHHHVHTDPAVWKAIEPLVIEYGFKTVRLSRNLYEGGSILNRVYKQRYNNRIRKIGKAAVEYFGSYYDFEEYYKNLPDGSISEIMVHPTFTEDGELVDTYGDVFTPMVDIKERLEWVKSKKCN